MSFTQQHLDVIEKAIARVKKPFALATAPSSTAPSTSFCRRAKKFAPRCSTLLGRVHAWSGFITEAKDCNGSLSDADP